MYDEVVSRLYQLGYAATSEDEAAINFQITTTLNEVKMSCNIEKIPELLNNQIVEKVCGEFLFYKYGTGQLTETNFDFDMVAKSIKVGDTQIQYDLSDGDSTPSKRFYTVVNTLRNSFARTLTSFRCLKW
jgi:hypothetical protein